MLYGKIFRSTRGARAHQAHRRRRGAGASAACTAWSPAKTSASSFPSPITAPRSTTSRCSRVDKVRYVGEPVAVVLASDPHVAEEAAHLITAEYEELPAVYDEVEAMTSKAIVHDELKPAGTFPDLKHLKGRTNTNVALDFHLRRGDAAKPR